MSDPDRFPTRDVTLLHRPNVVFLGLAMLAFVVATLGADTYARVHVSGQTVEHAVRQHAYWAVHQSVGTALLFTPFATLAWMSASLAKTAGSARGLALFVVVSGIFICMYFFGYHDSQHYMNRRMWTAATLAVGLLPVQCVPVLVLCLVARWLLSRRKEPSTPPMQATGSADGDSA